MNFIAPVMKDSVDAVPKVPTMHSKAHSDDTSPVIARNFNFNSS